MTARSMSALGTLILGLGMASACRPAPERQAEDRARVAATAAVSPGFLQAVMDTGDIVLGTDGSVAYMAELDIAIPRTVAQQPRRGGTARIRLENVGGDAWTEGGLDREDFLVVWVYPDRDSSSLLGRAVLSLVDHGADGQFEGEDQVTDRLEILPPTPEVRRLQSASFQRRGWLYRADRSAESETGRRLFELLLQQINDSLASGERLRPSPSPWTPRSQIG